MEGIDVRVPWRVPGIALGSRAWLLIYATPLPGNGGIVLFEARIPWARPRIHA